MASTTKQSTSTSAGKFAAKAKDLEALRDAVVDAASVGAGLWLSYLFVFFYLFIAVAAVTHRDLLFESPINLPFLNVELPLLGFFVLGPLLFLIMYAYVLLHFALLAGKVGAFRAALEAQIRDKDTRARLRRQLPSNIFVQYLAGPHEVRTGVMGWMLRLITVITLVIFPIALLVFFELQFLPFHSAPITWWHRIAVVIGLLLLWMMSPAIAQADARWVVWRNVRQPKTVTLMLASLIPILLVFTIATFPGEWLDRNLPSLRLVPTKWPNLKSEDHRAEQTQGEAENKHEDWPDPAAVLKSIGWTSLHDLLVAGDVDLIARKPGSLWSNVLVLPGIDVIDHAKYDSEEKIAALPETISLRGRRLEGAVFIGANLRKVDLTAAQLQGADLDNAQLQGAWLWDVELQGAKLDGANLDLALLDNVFV